MKITYENKEGLKVVDLPHKNQVRDADLNEIKEKHNSYLNSLGWVDYRDTINTESNRQNLTAGSDQKITINAGTSVLSYAPTDGEGLWDSVNNKIQPINIGDAYVIRVDFKATISSNDGYFEFGLIVGGTIGRAFGEMKVFPKGLNVIHNFSIDFPVYALDTFLPNGGEIVINPSHTMTIFDKRIIIIKVVHGVL
jgi:hypothetical protein